MGLRLGVGAGVKVKAKLYTPLSRKKSKKILGIPAGGSRSLIGRFWYNTPRTRLTIIVIDLRMSVPIIGTDILKSITCAIIASCNQLV